MGSQRTFGMIVIALLSMLLGATSAILFTIEVVRGETFDGLIVDSPVKVALGLAAAIFSLMLFYGGVGTWRLNPSGRRMSLVAAAGTLMAFGAATILYEEITLRYFFLGALYPVVLFISFSQAKWRAVFAAPVD